MTYNHQNVFARILRNEIPYKRIAGDDYFLSFHTIDPKAQVHVLVIPTGTYIDAQDFHTHASPQEITGFYKGVASVIDHLNLYETGFRQISNCGVNGGQEVPHYHIHILGGSKLGPMITNHE